MAKSANIWTGSEWVSLIGPEGPKGDPGKDGSGVTIQGTATTWPPSATPGAGDMYLLGDPVPAGAPVGSSPGDGVVWTGSSWVNVGAIRGPQGAPGADGADGAPGIDGQNGADGSAASVAVGTVTALPAGSTPIVTNSGTALAAVLNFSIPAGAAGSDGADGADGAKGDKGDKGDQGTAGADGVDGNSIEVFVQASEPTPARPGALWIDNT
jgi:hypothetical protein